MLEHLQKDNWLPHLGDTFELSTTGGASLPLTLVEVEGFGPKPGIPREGYSLQFAGPTNPIFPQSIYRLGHPTLGELDLFLVPIGPNAGTMRYEAVFN